MIIKGDRMIYYIEAAQILELLLKDANDNPLQNYQITSAIPETVGLPVNVLKNIPNKAVPMSLRGDPPDNIWEPPWWMAFWLIFLNFLFPGIGLLLFGGFIVMGAFMQSFTSHIVTTNGLAATTIKGPLGVIQNGINKIARLSMNSIRKTGELGRSFLLKSMRIQISPIIRELGGDATIISDSIQFTLDGLYFNTQINFKDKHDASMNSDVPYIDFKMSSNDKREYVSSSSLLKSPQFSRNSDIDSVTKAISSRLNVDFLSLFRQIKRPVIDQSSVTDLKIQTIQQSSLIKNSIYNFLDGIPLDGGISFQKVDDQLRIIDSSITERFKSLETAPNYKDNWNFYDPFLNLFNKRLYHDITEFKGGTFKDYGGVMDLIPQSVRNYAITFCQTYSPTLENLKTSFEPIISEDQSLSNTLLTLNSYSNDEDIEPNSVSVFSFLNTEKDSISRLSVELVTNLLNSGFQPIEKVMEHMSTTISMGMTVKSDNPDIQSIEKAWWGGWALDKATKFLDGLDAIDDVLKDEIKTDIPLAIVTSILCCMVGFWQMLTGYGIGLKAQSLYDTKVFTDLAYQGYMTWANNLVSSGEIELLHTFIELCYEIYTFASQDDEEADIISAIISTILESYAFIPEENGGLPAAYDVELTEQDAIDLNNFLNIKGLVCGLVSDWGVAAIDVAYDFASKYAMYGAVALILVIHIFQTINGAIFAYSIGDKWMFVLVIVLGILGI